MTLSTAYQYVASAVRNQEPRIFGPSGSLLLARPPDANVKLDFVGAAGDKLDEF